MTQHFPQTTALIDQRYTHDQLRIIAKSHKVPSGRNKLDTINNLLEIGKISNKVGLSPAHRD